MSEFLNPCYSPALPGARQTYALRSPQGNHYGSADLLLGELLNAVEGEQRSQAQDFDLSLSPLRCRSDFEPTKLGRFVGLGRVHTFYGGPLAMTLSDGLAYLLEGLGISQTLETLSAFIFRAQRQVARPAGFWGGGYFWLRPDGIFIGASLDGQVSGSAAHDALLETPILIEVQLKNGVPRLHLSGENQQASPHSKATNPANQPSTSQHYRVSFDRYGPAAYGTIEAVETVLARILMRRSAGEPGLEVHIKRLPSLQTVAHNLELEGHIGTTYWHPYIGSTLRPFYLTDGAADLLEQTGCIRLYEEITGMVSAHCRHDPFLAIHLKPEGEVEYTNGNLTIYAASRNAPPLLHPQNLYCVFAEDLGGYVLMLAREH